MRRALAVLGWVVGSLGCSDAAVERAFLPSPSPATPLTPGASDAGPLGPTPPASPPDAADAGPLGASPLDDGAPPVPPVDAGTGGGCEGAVVCEDFESDPPGGVPDAGPIWSVSAPDCSGEGALAIDETEAHSGARSLKVTGAAGYCNHVFLSTSVVATLPGPVWARFYVRLTTPLDATHATLLAMHDAHDSGDLRMGGQDSILMWNRQSDDATLPELSPAGTALSVVPTAGAWHCVELDVEPGARSLQTWFDGALVAGLVAGSPNVPDVNGEWLRDTSWAPRLVDARFGWESYSGESETLWFDDIAIGPSRLGCAL